MNLRTSIIVATFAILLPTPLFAAQESILPEASLPPVPTTQRDPYLAQAINGLPSYSSQQAGLAVALTSLRTVAGNWPKPLLASPSIPTNGTILMLEGEASYYSRAGCLGCDPAMIMANGQPLNDNALTMAIGAHLKHLVGYQAKVTSLATGKSVTARITDTGGFYQAKYGHRVADLTIATKNAIGMAGGVGQVRVEVF
jgi:rare lipoprotein A (peptidoglycan hydrolase)